MASKIEVATGKMNKGPMAPGNQKKTQIWTHVYRNFKKNMVKMLGYYVSVKISSIYRTKSSIIKK